MVGLKFHTLGQGSELAVYRAPASAVCRAYLPAGDGYRSPQGPRWEGGFDLFITLEFCLQKGS